VTNQSWEVTAGQVSPEQWALLLELFDDANFYQTYTYGQVRWGAKNLSHLILKRRGEVVALAQLRIFRPAIWMGGVAYLRWGPICKRRDRPLDPVVVERMAEALHEEYSCKRDLFLYVQPKSFVKSPETDSVQYGFSSFAAAPAIPDYSYKTLMLDLSPAIEELRRNLDRKWRNQLTRAEKNNLRVVAGNGAAGFRRFCELYKQMRKRKRFHTKVNIVEFERMQESLPDSQRMRVLICEDASSGVPVAGLVASCLGDTAIYMLGATGDHGLKSKGAYLLQWSLIKWLKENGVRRYDLGGIDPKFNPGLYHFKRGLSSAEMVQMGAFIAPGNGPYLAALKVASATQRAIRSARRTPSLDAALGFPTT
jgi:lipid II:glycine glycyltransferase (peptidoglycan interpeptide bridge formation enzyme)